MTAKGTVPVIRSRENVSACQERPDPDVTSTAKPTCLGQTAPRPASVRTAPSVTRGTAAAAACRAGSESPVRKEDLHASPTATAETHNRTTHYSTTAGDSSKHQLFTEVSEMW